MRKHFLDNLRCGMVLLHVVYPWMMPAMFVLSGVSTRCALEGQTMKRFMGRQARRRYRRF